MDQDLFEKGLAARKATLGEAYVETALAEADEAFLASSTRDVQPIRSVDGRLLPAVPGQLTATAAAAFTALEARTLDP